MKKILLSAAVISAILASCSSDETDNSASNGNAAAYFPEVNGNYWTYDVKSTDFTTRDSLFVLKDTVISSKTYKKMDTKTTPTGFLSGSLRKNGLRSSGSKLLMTGGLEQNFFPSMPLNLQVKDFVIFNESASANETLATTSGTIEQTMQEIPIKIEYTLKSVAKAHLATFTSPDNEVYTDVKPVDVILKMKISAVMQVAGNPISVPILDSQEVVKSTQYYAKNIGVVYTNTNMHYELKDFSKYGIELPLPQSANVLQEEFLDKYKNAN